MVIVEDVHWAEPPMLDLVDSVVERVHGAVLFLCLARPELLELRPSWAAAKPRSITATLPPLTSRDARRIGEALLGETAPTSVVERVCGTAEGNPLYLEQLTAMLADQGLVVDGEWCGSDDVEVEIPGSLQALLAARLTGSIPRHAWCSNSPRSRDGDFAPQRWECSPPNSTRIRSNRR